MKRILLTTFSIIAGLFANIIHAATTEVANHTIPAAACQPNSTSAAAKIYLSSNGWNFLSGQTGTAVLYCSLPLSTFAGYVSGPNNDLTMIRLAYRDTDGQGTAARIYARMFSRTTTGSTLWHQGFNSNTAAATGYTNGWASGGYDFNWYDFQGAYVTMYRANTSQYPVFVGIDFLFPPIP